MYFLIISYELSVFTHSHSGLSFLSLQSIKLHLFPSYQIKTITIGGAVKALQHSKEPRFRIDLSSRLAPDLRLSGLIGLK